MQATGNKQKQPYYLSIRLHADGFSFYSYNLEGVETVEVETYAFKADEQPEDTLENALTNSSIIKADHYEMSYGIVHGPAIQVPLEHFRKDEAANLLRLTYRNPQIGKIYYNILPHLEIAQVFTIAQNMEETLKRHLPNIRLYHSQTMILEKMSGFADTEETCLFAYFQEKDLFIFGYTEQRLRYANTFKIETPENTLYYILSVCKELGIDGENGECFLIGPHEYKNKTADTLSKYVHSVKNATPINIFRSSALARNKRVPFDILALFANL